MRKQFSSRTKQANCSARFRLAESQTLGAIVAHYLANYSKNTERELEYYRRQPTIDTAVEVASLARLPSGKRAHHQRRLSSATLNAAWNALRDCDLGECHDFHSLFCTIDKTVRPIDGIGELYVYDTSLRIGAFLQLSPAHVYLHAGTRAGARALGFSGVYSIDVSELPREFGNLEPYQIEDCLCIYKDELAKTQSRVKQ
jgi:hypothetical protein